MSGVQITVVELPLFPRQAAGVWDGAERAAFVDSIARNPEVGDVIPETGGVRKVRWRRQGTGKRGGTRVVNFHHNAQTPLSLILVYAKAQREGMTADERNEVKALASALRHR